MAVSKEKMAEILGRAQKLCSPAGDRLLNEFSNKSGGGMSNTPLPPPDYSSAGWDDDMYVGDSYGQSQVQYQGAPLGENHTMMPDAIRNSMMSNPIDTSAFDVDEMNTVAKMMPRRKVQQRAQLNEQVSNSSPMSTGIDYSVLRAIINECIDTKLREYLGGERQSLNENTLAGIKLSDGNIKLIDNGGRVFKAKLEYVGKPNKKQG